MKINVGASSCLLGEKVRWNGDHKKDDYVQQVLGQFFKWIPCCPEADIGMGIPREPVRLVGNEHSPLMLGTKSNKDWTKKMNQYTKKRVTSFSKEDLCGYILKKGSPSCGMERVPLYSPDGKRKSANSVGLFAKSLIEQFPLLPIEEEGRLNDAGIRENFIVRVFSFYRLKQLLKNFSKHALIEFHTEHKYLLMAHSQKHYKILGRVVADSKKIPTPKLKSMYSENFMESLCIKSTVKKNVNILQHMLGYFKNDLDQNEKKELLDVINDYHKKLVPLIVPITLIRHYVNKYNQEYLSRQIYLNPNPKELMLRNHV